MMKFFESIAAIGCVIGLAAATPALAGVIGSGDSSTYQDLAGYYPSVGQIYGSDASGSFAASGVVIAPNWVLTAAHVVSGATSLNFYLDGGGDFSSFANRNAIIANDWFAYSKYDGNLNSGYDIGLIHFDTNFVTTFGINPVALYSGTSEVGMVGTFVGYGMTGTGTTGATTFDGLKRAGQNMIDAVAITPGKDKRILLSDFDSGLASDNSYGSAIPLTYEGMIAPGDSGGGMFVPCGGITTYDDCLAGITSFGWGRLDGDPNSDFGDVGGFTRVSSFISWINSFIGSPSSGGGGGGKGGGPKPRGTSGLVATDISVPEPITLSLFGAGLAGMIAMRRRKKKAA